MLPSLYIPPFTVFGGLTIQPFGLLVAIAVVVGCALGRRHGRIIGLDPKICAEGQIWILTGGFVASHWLSMLLYFPAQVVSEPWRLLLVWESFSSFGGFTGGIMVGIYYFHLKKAAVLKYCDAYIYGFVPAWIIGRIGCTIVFDHPGVPTTFFLGMVHYGDSIVRHNLGFYEVLQSILLTLVLYALKNVRPFDGFHSALIMLLYSPVRFFFDFLRETEAFAGDRRYFDLTPGQYFAVGLAMLGMAIIINGLRSKHHPRAGFP